MNNDYPLVVVGIVTFNRCGLLKITLDNIFKQNYPNLFVVVFNNGSIDNTELFLKNYDDIVTINSAENIDIIDARNRIMSGYEGDYYFGLDDDAWPLSNDLVTRSVDFMQNNSNVAILGMDILSPSNRESSFVRKLPFQSASFIACGCMLRKSSIKDVGYYSKFIGYYGPEEDDLSLKLMDLGYDIVAYPGLFIWHETTLQSRDLNKQWRSQVGNVLALVVKFYPLGLLLPLFFLKFLSLLVYSGRKGLTCIFFEGIKIFCINLPTLIKQRKPLKVNTILHFHKLVRQIQ